MQYKLIIIFFLTLSCVNNSSNYTPKIAFNSKGLAFVYDENDFKNKIINKKLDNNYLQIAHNKLRPGTLIKIVNLDTNDEILLKNTKKIQFPDMYKILITKSVASRINLSMDFPLVEILEIKKNKSFIAKKSEMFKEEKKIYSKAPVTNIKIDNISKKNNNSSSLKSNQKKNIYIIIGEFYSKNFVALLKERISKELHNFDVNKLYVKSLNANKIRLLSGPYTSVNLMKNDYIQLKNFGFEELDININE